VVVRVLGKWLAYLTGEDDDVVTIVGKFFEEIAPQVADSCEGDGQFFRHGTDWPILRRIHCSC
jgi:hypothetical protein